MDAAHTSETNRLEAFCDGVFAIAITLLILEIKVPTVAQAAASGGLLRALAAQWPSFISYLISFVTVGIMWINHHAMFQYIRRTDRNLMLLHIPFLLLISAVPYPTSLVAAFFGTPDARAAVMLYGTTFFAIALAYDAIWFYGTRDPHLRGEQVHEHGLRTISARYAVGPVSYVLATLLALLNVTAAIVCFAMLAAFFALPERKKRN